MTPRLVFTPEAQRGLDEAADWYARQAHGLDGRFLDAVDLLIERLLANPYQYAEFSPGVRRAKPRRFPYIFYYRIQTGQIAVLAVAHAHRDPRSVVDRL